MQYRDVYKIQPGSYEWRYLSPANYVLDHEQSPEFFKSDYKTPYRQSPHFLRKIKPYNPPGQKVFLEPLKSEQDLLDRTFEELPGFKDYLYKGNTKIVKRPGIQC